ncbi:MAG TPA: hypothetical protein VKD91_12360 [Pyrinomonadaceae bacterium]|nr:hypothetical protein [Pyrinomonadaceae bacterium]
MEPNQLYDRNLLLGGPERNAVLELWEVRRYGADTFGDEDYVCIFGLAPERWYAKGVRLLGRTAVECTRDQLGDQIGKDVAAVVASPSRTRDLLVVDPFVGSGNTLYWLLRHLPGARGLGFESDPGVFRLTRSNLAALGLSIDVRNTDYLSGLNDLSVPENQRLIAFLAPPWGGALSPEAGLDLRRTSPPISDVVDVLLDWFASNPMVVAVQVYERMDADSLAALRSRFEWSALRIYDLNAPGENHGVLIGLKRWTREHEL